MKMAKQMSQMMLHVPYLNKGTAFNKIEREAHHLRGLLPPTIESLDKQVQRCLVQFQSFANNNNNNNNNKDKDKDNKGNKDNNNNKDKDNKSNNKSNLNQYTYLSSLKERNDTLFYKLVMENIETMMPIIYTPTVGEACEKFDREYRIPQGMYFSSCDKGEMRNMVDNWPHSDVAIIVVSDGSRILGLGDLGSNGMGIPVGKLGLYIAGGGFHPTTTLPVILDVGTNNKDLLNDEFYLGMKHERLKGKQYDELMDEFIKAVRAKWPKVLIQFEDFSNEHCFALLERYRHNILCFNDDIQGTGAVVLAGLINATKISKTKLEEQKFVVMGAGSAAVGCADLLCTYLKEEGIMEEKESKKLFWFVDSTGLVTTHRKEELSEEKKRYAREDIKESLSFKEVVEKVKPTGIIGLCGKAEVFDEEVVSKMTDYCERPIIFALSNPTSNSECTAEQAFKWTKGKCIFASGSPFPPVEYDGKKHTVPQANNVYIFPGLGLGSSLCEAEKVTPSMVSASAKALADLVSKKDLENGIIYPELSKIRQVSAHIASKVMAQAYKEKVAKAKLEDKDMKDLEKYVREKQYVPDYSFNVSSAL